MQTYRFRLLSTFYLYPIIIESKTFVHETSNSIKNVLILKR
ncbi:hypothetical protein LEP1GSC125_1643 [Leptospira mayottensis 200901122]|uniref:Uncharacterized protein n=1 Tax=Leptospira mayottensis 200901122 TaxID=1193010 RepID=A0AA87MM75_9LEPT|nr:hypothetical protein LEP1GSC125_1643 [Leptospira mayottensis 200901122]